MAFSYWRTGNFEGGVFRAAANQGAQGTQRDTGFCGYGYSNYILGGWGRTGWDKWAWSSSCLFSTVGLSLWTPDLLGASLKSWLEGDLLTGANGSSVASWTDASGNGNTATAAVAPTLSVAGRNGLNVVGFNGTQSLTLPNFVSGFTEGSAFFVAKLTTDPATAAPIIGDFGTSGSAEHYPFSDNNIYDGFLSTTRKTVGDPGNLAAWHIGSFQSKASDWRYAFNGTDFFTTATNTVGAGTAPRIGYNGTNLLDGQIAEIIICNSFLTTVERQKVEGYLAWKWGLVPALDAAHPYKTVPPRAFPLAVDVGVYTITGTPTGLKAARNLVEAVGNYSLAGTALQFVPARKLVAVSGAYSISGTATNLRIARKLTEAVGAYVINGTATGLGLGRKTAAAVGNYSIVGTATALRIARKQSETVGSYSLTGTATGLRTARRLAGVPGAYAINGSAVTLTYTPASSAAVLVATPGAYSLNGSAVTLRVARRLITISGHYVLTGNDVALIYDPVWDVAPPVSPAFTESVPNNGIWTVTPPNTGTWS